MAKYFLDTHVFYRFLTDDDRLDKNIQKSIADPKPKEQYVVSDFVILELMQLKQLNKIIFPEGLEGIFKVMNYYNIQSDKLDDTVWLELDKIPMQKIHGNLHSDPFDRIMIAHCIHYQYTMISADTKFPHYRQFGLQLLEV